MTGPAETLAERLTYFPASPPSPPPPASPASPPHASVLLLPGGGYLGHGPHEAEPVAHWLNGLGLGVFLLRYRTPPEHPVEPLDDARAAMRLIREHPAADPSRVAVLGFSAGGHLAAWLAGGARTAPAERPDLAILGYPLVSFAHLPHQGSSAALLGPEPSPSERRAVSQELSVHPATPPVFCWHTADDDAVDVEHSLRYAAALRRAEVPVELHVLPHGPHGLGLAPDAPYVARWTRWCAEWLDGHGWL